LDGVVDEAAIAERYRLLSSGKALNERTRRLWAAAEARSHGYGGISAVSRATGIDQETIRRGVRELESGEVLAEGRVRRPGAGNKPVAESHPGIEEELERLVAPETRGDPCSPLRWTSKSAAKLARALAERGYEVSDRTVLRLLKRMGYSLQANQKAREGADHPDRDAQFARINDTVAQAIRQGQPVISVDTKKRELVGDFKAVGRELEPKGKPTLVRTHDFKDKDLGHAIPYGVLDLTRDEGWVNVGVDRDTAQFAAASIRGWWENLGSKRYPHASELTITADAGGSNSYRTRLWKVELQKLADATGLKVTVCHFPPGTSKWNRIEHRLFSFMSLNWRGKPLISHEVIISLIAATTTSTGLKVYAQLDDRPYPKEVEVTDQELAAVNITRNSFHGEWNYRIAPSITES
jgi:transposase